MYTRIIYAVYILLFLQLSLFCSELQLTPTEKLWLEKHPKITVSNEDDWPPYDFSIDGEAKGYSVDLVKLLAKKIGIEVSFINGYSWAELLKEFDKKHIDLMQAMAGSKERREKYSFSKPYMPWRLSYFVLENRTDIESTKDFKGKKIAAGKAWSTTKILKKNFPEADIIEYKDSSAMLDALMTSKVDILIDNTNVLNYIMRENLLSGVKHVGYLDFANKDQNKLYFVAHKEDSPLTSMFTKAFESLDADEKEKLQKRWFSSVATQAHMHTIPNNKNSKINFTAKERAYLQKKKVIKMCIDPKWMPYEGFNDKGQFIGISADFFKIFQQEIGIPIKIIHTQSWQESLQYAKERKCDILSLVAKTPEREKYLNFTEPYLNMPLVMATKPNVVFFNDFGVLKDKKIGIVKGYAFNEVIRKKYPNFDVVDVKNIREGLDKVVSGELFGYIGTLPSIGYIFQKRYIGELKIVGQFDEKWRLGTAVRNDDKILFDIFEKVVTSIPEDVRQRIIFKTIAIKYDQYMDYWLIAKIMLVVLFLVAFLVYHNRKLSRMNKKLEELQNKLQEQANRDPMTNLYNRRYFHEVTANILEIAKREKKPFSLIMVDIDNFKNINDKYGHAVGDEVIKQLSLLLSKNVRSSDIVSRFGGEEFVILLPNTDLRGAQKIAAKIRESVENLQLHIDNKTIHFTISLGVSNFLPGDDSIEEILKRADQALYKAKRNGKNRTVIFDQ